MSFRLADHVMLVTVGESEPVNANLLMEGNLDKSAHISAGGDNVCFELAICGDDE